MAAGTGVGGRDSDQGGARPRRRRCGAREAAPSHASGRQETRGARPPFVAGNDRHVIASLLVSLRWWRCAPPFHDCRDTRGRRRRQQQHTQNLTPGDMDCLAPPLIQRRCILEAIRRAQLSPATHPLQARLTPRGARSPGLAARATPHRAADCGRGGRGRRVEAICGAGGIEALLGVWPGGLDSGRRRALGGGCTDSDWRFGSDGVRQIQAYHSAAGGCDKAVVGDGVWYAAAASRHCPARPDSRPCGVRVCGPGPCF